MTHSQQPSIDILQAMSKTKYSNSKFDRKKALIDAIERIQELPQEQSLEQLLEEMPNFTEIIKGAECRATAFSFTGQPVAYGKTPREALLALRDKLSKQ